MSQASAGLRENSSSGSGSGSIGGIVLDCCLAWLLLKSLDSTCLLGLDKVCDISRRS